MKIGSGLSSLTKCLPNYSQTRSSWSCPFGGMVTLTVISLCWTCLFFQVTDYAAQRLLPIRPDLYLAACPAVCINVLKTSTGAVEKCSKYDFAPRPVPTNIRKENRRYLGEEHAWWSHEMLPEINVSSSHKYVSSGNLWRKIFRSLHCDDMRYQCKNIDHSILQNAEKHLNINLLFLESLLGLTLKVVCDRIII